MSNPIDVPRQNLIDLDALAGLEPNAPAIELSLTPRSRRRLVPSLNSVCTHCGHHQLVTPTAAYPIHTDVVARRRDDGPGQDEWACYVFRTCGGCGMKGARFITVSRQATLDERHQWSNYENRLRDEEAAATLKQWHRYARLLGKAGAPLLKPSAGLRTYPEPALRITWWSDGAMSTQVCGRALGRAVFPVALEVDMLREALVVVRNRDRHAWLVSSHWGTDDAKHNQLYKIVRAAR